MLRHQTDPVAAYAIYSKADKSLDKGRPARDADTQCFLALMVRASRLPDKHISYHAFEAVSMLTQEKKRLVERDRDAVACLVGHLRHPELARRVAALRALYTCVRSLFSF